MLTIAFGSRWWLHKQGLLLVSIRVSNGALFESRSRLQWERKKFMTMRQTHTHTHTHM